MTASLRVRALALLARREFARAELAARLAPRAGPDDDLDGLLDALEREGLLSDARFGEAMARRHRGRHGAAWLTAALRARGVDEAVVQAQAAAARATEPDLALQALRRKYPEPPGDRDDWARQARFLRNRGFDADAIRQALRAPADT